MSERRGVFYFFLISVFFFPLSAYSSSIFGGSGLVHVPYANTTLKGSYDVGLFAIYTQNKDDLRGQTGTLMLTSYYGIYDWLELDFNFPFYIVSPEWMGISSTMIGVKGRFFKSKMFKFSLFPYLKPSFAGDPHVGTGKLGYGASFIGELDIKKISLLGRIGYEKGEYFPPNGNKYVQDNLILGAAGAKWDISEKLDFFGELVGSSARTYHDEDLFFQLGMKLYPLPNIVLTISGGTGAAGELRSNTDRRVVAGLTYYSVPLPPPAIPQKKVRKAPPKKKKAVAKKPAPAPQKVVQQRRVPTVLVISSCNDPQSSEQIARMFERNGLKVIRPIVSSKQLVGTTEVIFSTAQNLAFKIARWIPGRQKIIKRIPLGYNADVVVRVGCDVSTKAKEKKKPISQIKIAVLNACQSGVLVAENVAKILLLAGYNVERIGEYERYDHKNYTEILFKPLYRDYANIISQKIPGQQRLRMIPPTQGEEEIVILVGCDQMKK